MKKSINSKFAKEKKIRIDHSLDIKGYVVSFLLVFTGETPQKANIFSAFNFLISGISTSVLEVHILDVDAMSSELSFREVGQII